MALFFSIAVYTAANPIYGYSGVDSACFFLIGRGIVNGYVPYVDLVDNKGVILYFLNALPLLFYPDKMSALARITIWVEELLFLFASLRMIVFISKKFGLNQGFFPQLFYLISLMPFIESGNMCEEYTNFFTLVALTFFVKYIFNTKETFSWTYGFSFGTMFALSFFVRPNNALPIAAIIVVFGIGFIAKREYKHLVNYAVTGIGGSLAVCVPVYVYLSMNDALRDCVEQTFIANMGYSGDSGSSITEIFFTKYGFTALCILAISLMGMSVVLFSRNTYKMKLYASAVGFSSLLAYISCFLSRFTYFHYLLIGITPMVMAFILLCAHRKNFAEGATRPKNGKHLFGQAYSFEFKRGASIILSFFIIAFSFIDVYGRGIANLKGFPANVKNFIAVEIKNDEAYGYNAHTAMANLASNIPLNEKDNVYVLDGGTTNACNLYVQMEILPAKRLIISADRFARVLPSLGEEYERYFIDEPPIWLITATEPNREGYPEYETLHEKYTFVAKNDYGVCLFKRTEENSPVGKRTESKFS
jgi:hypothetical protein